MNYTKETYLTELAKIISSNYGVEEKNVPNYRYMKLYSRDYSLELIRHVVNEWIKTKPKIPQITDIIERCQLIYEYEKLFNKQPCNSRVQDIKQIQQIKRLYREHIIDVLKSATGKDSLVTTEINDCVRILSHLEKQEEFNRK